MNTTMPTIGVISGGGGSIDDLVYTAIDNTNGSKTASIENGKRYMLIYIGNTGRTLTISSGATDISESDLTTGSGMFGKQVKFTANASTLAYSISSSLVFTGLYAMSN